MIDSSLIILAHACLSFIIIGHLRSFLVIIDGPRSCLLIIDHPFDYSLIFPLIMPESCNSLRPLFGNPSLVVIAGGRTPQVHACLPSCLSNSRVHWPKPLRLQPLRQPRPWRRRIEVRPSCIESKLEGQKDQKRSDLYRMIFFSSCWGWRSFYAVKQMFLLNISSGTHVLDKDKVAEFEGRWPSPPASPKSVNVSLPK